MKKIIFTILILLLPCLSGILFCFEKKEITFDRISVEAGLSQDTISCILQDSKGFMWFGTMDGLNKYDGNHFTVYVPIPGDANSLSFNYITAIHEDASGMLWIGTYGGGLNKFDRKKEIFTCYKNEPNNPNSLSDNYVITIFEDQSGILWIGTGSGGLNKFDRE
jgi:ligand-binding sensor domain-containing protein